VKYKAKYLFFSLILTVISLFFWQPEGILPHLQARKSFSFYKFISLKKGKFSIVVNGKEVGTGKIVKLNKKQLQLRFHLRPAFRKIQGFVNMRYKRSNRNHVFIRIKYKGKRKNRIEQSNETVTVPTFLANNGILTFHYMKRKRFFQLSRNSKGRTKIVTDWGIAALIQR